VKHAMVREESLQITLEIQEALSVLIVMEQEEKLKQQSKFTDMARSRISFLEY
jgi:hypothetical protein